MSSSCTSSATPEDKVIRGYNRDAEIEGLEQKSRRLGIVNTTFSWLIINIL